MGQSKRWRARFASWVRALPRGMKWAAGFGMFVAAYLIVVPLSNLIIVSVLYPGPITCRCSAANGRPRFTRTTPIWDMPDPVKAQEMCDRAWAGLDR